VKIALPLAAIAGLPLALHGVKLGAVAHRIASLPCEAVLLAAGFALLQVCVLATRFWMVIARAQRPRWSSVARAFSFGQAANVYLPGRAGDVLRGVVLAKADARVSVSDATGAMLADKGLDVCTLVLVGVAFGHGAIVSALASSGHAAVVALGALVVLGALALLVRRFLPRVFDRLRSAAVATRTAARGLFTPKRLALALGLGVAAWLAEISMMSVLCAALGAHVTFPQATAALLVLNLGIAVPVTVGNLGAYEAAVAMGLTRFGVPLGDAIAVGMLHHATQIAAAILPALFFWGLDRARRLTARVIPSPRTQNTSTVSCTMQSA
jgi:uncharacterized membrane protein YbhN (UPF0104 family)